MSREWAACRNASEEWAAMASDLVEPLMRTAEAVVAWLRLRWSLSGQPGAWAVVMALAFVVVTTLVTPVWHAARNAVTIVHEMGHVVVAKLCGRTISGIKLHTDTSGLAITRGRPRGPGMLLTSLAGYPSPGLVGLGMTWAAVSGHAGAALLLLSLLLCLALLLVRNLWGVLIVTASLLGAGLVLHQADPRFVSALVLTTGAFLALGSLRAAWDLCREHWGGRALRSDAVSAAASGFLPAAVWLGFFVATTGVCAVWALWMTAGALLSA